MFWHATKEIARKEFLTLVRSKRLLGVGIATIVTMVLISLVAPLVLLNIQDFLDGVVGEQGSSFGDIAGIDYIHNALLLFFLTGFFILSGFFLLQLAPVILASDAVATEWKNRSIFLLLSKPVPRPAMVLGKFIGIVGPLAAMSFLLLLVDYTIIIAVFPGVPTWAEFGRFLGASMIIMLGIIAFGALSILFSTLAKSGTASMLLTIVTWIVIFPLLSNIQFFIDLGQGGFEAITGEVTWSNFLSPATMMEQATGVLVPTEIGLIATLLGGGFGQGTASWWAAGLALLGHTFVYLVAAVLVVQVRNFE